MLNKHRADISIEFPSGPLLLRPTFEALAAIEDRLGVSAFAALMELSEIKTCRLSRIVSIIECAANAHPSNKKVPNRAEIGEHLQSVGWTSVLPAVVELLSKGLTSDADLAKIEDSKAVEDHPTKP